MEEQVKLPDMGEGVESAVVVGLLVEVGDDVEVDQGIVELETDKAVAEVPSPKAGTVKKIHVETDQEITPGTLLLTLDVPDEQTDRSGQEGQETQPTEGPQEPSERQESGEGEQKGKKPSSKKKAKSPKPSKDEEKTPEESSEQPQKPAKSKQRTEPPASGNARPADIPAAPSVRRLARELGLDLGALRGSGTGGWITEQDVKDAARTTLQRRGGAGATDDWGPVRRERLRSIRRSIAEKMQQSHANTVTVTHFDDADVTDLEAFRTEHKHDLADEGVELTLLPFVVRAVVGALTAHPRVNASLDLDAGEIVYKDYISLSIAVDTDRGLIAPVLRDADRLSVAEVARALHDLADRARAGEFELADLRGGTFSLSNLGSIAGRYATPIINYPESAVLLTGRAGPTPVVRDGRVVVRTLLPLSLSYDHRLIDGAEAARFLRDLIASLESPARLLTR